MTNFFLVNLSIYIINGIVLLVLLVNDTAKRCAKKTKRNLYKLVPVV